MELMPHELPGVYNVVFDSSEDQRGEMERLYVDGCIQELNNSHWKQVLISRTQKANTIRGLYIQSPPYEEAKLIRVLSGSVFWVAVDLRPYSQTFGKWTSCVLSHDEPKGMYIERGFAHGCLSLRDDTSILLLADNVHHPGAAYGIKWSDEEIGIEWPLLSREVVISPEHDSYSSFAVFKSRQSQPI